MEKGPRFGRYTLVALVACIALAIYALVTGNPAGVVLLVVLVVFAGVPALLLAVLARRAPPRDGRHR